MLCYSMKRFYGYDHGYCCLYSVFRAGLCFGRSFTGAFDNLCVCSAFSGVSGSAYLLYGGCCEARVVVVSVKSYRWGNFGSHLLHIEQVLSTYAQFCLCCRRCTPRKFIKWEAAVGKSMPGLPSGGGHKVLLQPSCISPGT